MQIYQPGKRRGGSTTGTSEHEDAVEYKSPNSPEIECMESIELEKPAPSMKSNNRKRSDAKDKESSKSQNDERKKPSNEKRISRYSEKRNKAKEKRDVTDNPVATGDCNSNSNDTGKNDEMS